ncbi:MAG: hypothetical protein WCE54_18885 [Ignavibacteriaceae bacterium]
MSEEKKEKISKIIKQLADLPAEKREELSSINNNYRFKKCAQSVPKIGLILINSD